MAANRQTKMLAMYDSSFGPCYHIENERSEYFDNLLLEKAKQGLRKMSFFGLTEFQTYSQQLLLSTFKGALNFSREIEQLQSSLADETMKKLDASIIREIERVNELDFKLYEYAKRLFFERMAFFNLSFNNTSKS